MPTFFFFSSMKYFFFISLLFYDQKRLIQPKVQENYIYIFKMKSIFIMKIYCAKFQKRKIFLPEFFYFSFYIYYLCLWWHWKMHIYLFQIVFLDASSHLYRRVCPSVGPLVRPSVDWSRFRKKQYFCANDLRGGILDGSHVITSSYNHFIIMWRHEDASLALWALLGKSFSYDFFTWEEVY